MSNVMIVIIIAIAGFIGLKETIKQFKGEGACCSINDIDGAAAKVSLNKKIAQVYLDFLNTEISFLLSFQVDNSKDVLLQEH